VDYLPPSEVLDCHRLFGDFQVTLKKREVKDHYIISTLQLKVRIQKAMQRNACTFCVGEMFFEQHFVPFIHTYAQ
jgi:hypothetical protein